MFERSRVEYEYVNLYKNFAYGLTTFQPLGGGVVPGKCTNGIPTGTRFDHYWYKGQEDAILLKAKKVAEMEDVAKEIGCTLPQLALAWTAANEHVSTVLFSATSVEQLDENMKAVAFIEKVTPEVKSKIDAIIAFEPKLLPRYDGLTMGVRGKYLKH
ncbi:hypothetical protein Poli38472_007242 [Pythium oligandrum]|uniref:NADP-dependent oxidoreductase domain-containing protein n=1 Tax=Pythium oligandrum TaxID=41045 RepID=A0A8K1CAY7_PYTOL|nr:hypothetical protein Poli38472_007242 [Pythium oligandrum]|eukprot:TMW59097.1 hypothetical protein Poli38472_007242 [Pythium oligandrum]